MTSIQPELWVDAPREALAFYEAAFGATVLHLVGEGDDVVAQLGVGDAAFWVAPTSSTMKRLSLVRSTAPPAGRSWWSKIPTRLSARQWSPARRNPRPCRTSTAGGSVASSTPSGTSGRLARLSDHGHRLEGCGRRATRARAEDLPRAVLAQWGFVTDKPQMAERIDEPSLAVNAPWRLVVADLVDAAVCSSCHRTFDEGVGVIHEDLDSHRPRANGGGDVPAVVRGFT
jgi:hypothetical protein